MLSFHFGFQNTTFLLAVGSSLIAFFSQPTAEMLLNKKLSRYRQIAFIAILSALMVLAVNIEVFKKLQEAPTPTQTPTHVINTPASSSPQPPITIVPATALPTDDGSLDSTLSHTEIPTPMPDQAALPIDPASPSADVAPPMNDANAAIDDEAERNSTDSDLILVIVSPTPYIPTYGDSPSSSTPTEVPASTPTEVPASTPTEVPASTPTKVPTSTPTKVPTSTSVGVLV
ncbi:MAG: hypothetical protein HGA65_14710, partial [Oscillochloris sp.]|nr:hypothetical protein [Oscillochloris sp.]